MQREMIELLKAQHGLLTHADGRRLGFSSRQFARQAASGEWVEVYPHIFRHVAHPVTPVQRLLAACLSCGRDAVASHQSAAWLWGLLPAPPDRAAVTVPLGRSPRIHDFDVHRSGDLDWGRVLVKRGIECTDPLRTLVDLAGVATTGTVEAAVDRALATKLVTVAALEAETNRLSRQGRRGVRQLRLQLTGRGLTGAPHPSVLESRTLALMRRYQIPVEGGEVIHGPDGEYRIDFSLVPPVVLEVDGYAWHSSPEHKARDEHRRNILRLGGTELYVADWRQVTRDGRDLAGLLRAAIDRWREPAGQVAKSRTTLTSPG